MHGATCPCPHMPSWSGAELITRTPCLAGLEVGGECNTPAD